jgi:hypothetical protein
MSKDQKPERRRETATRETRRMRSKEGLEQQTKSNHNTGEQGEVIEFSQGARIRKGLHIPPTGGTSHRRRKFATRRGAPVEWRGAWRSTHKIV